MRHCLPWQRTARFNCELFACCKVWMCCHIRQGFLACYVMLIYTCCCCGEGKVFQSLSANIYLTAWQITCEVLDYSVLRLCKLRVRFLCRLLRRWPVPCFKGLPWFPQSNANYEFEQFMRANSSNMMLTSSLVISTQYKNNVCFIN